jgi:glycosyltransferase involved in cell wall biosynthesis
MNNRLISIVTPFKNRFDLFVETFNSLQAQSDNRFEWIIVDDHSLDEEFEKLSEIGRDHNFIRIYKAKTFGSNAARNLGLSKVKTNFVVFLDSDDIVGSEFIMNRINIIEANEKLDFYIFPVKLFFKSPNDSKILWNIKTEEKDLNRFTRVDTPWHTTSPLWRKEFIEKINRFNESCEIWQDWELHIRALLHSPTYKWIDLREIDIFYRKTAENSISAKDNTNEGLLKRLSTYKLLIKSSHKFDRLQKINLAHGLFRIANEMTGIQRKKTLKEIKSLLKSNSLISNLEIKLSAIRVGMMKKKITTHFIDFLLHKIYKRNFLIADTTFQKINDENNK